MDQASSEKPNPIYVDLDGTLLKSDLLLESLAVLAKTHTFMLILVPFWLLFGKANLKAKIASRAEIDIKSLPYNSKLLEYLTEKNNEGHRLILASASNEKYVAAVSRFLGIFDVYLASSHSTNLSGQHKLSAIQMDCGSSAFSYAGNDSVDLPIWSAADTAIVVTGSKALVERVKAVTEVTRVFVHDHKSVLQFIRALRPHQWSKNFLVFLPLVAAHRLDDTTLISHSVIAFIAFSLCASSVYLLNDMLDLASDRSHVRKRYRPFAAGSLSLSYAFLGAPLLLLIAFSLALTLPPAFIAVLAGYYVITLAYSFQIKRVIVLDVLTLAGLYTLRLVSGAAATSVDLSFWLLAFSMFLFLSLALLKRCSELLALRGEGKSDAHGRGYFSTDYQVLNQLGVSSGLVSVLVLALYINSDKIAELYAEPRFIWLLCPIVLYWIGRIWVKANRGEVHEDPIVFAAKDRRTYWLVLISALVVWLATGFPIA